MAAHVNAMVKITAEIVKMIREKVNEGVAEILEHGLGVLPVFLE